MRYNKIGSRTELCLYYISLVILTVFLGYSPAFSLSISKVHLRMVAVAYYGYGVSATSQANKPAFSLKGT